MILPLPSYVQALEQFKHTEINSLCHSLHADAEIPLSGLQPLPVLASAAEFSVDPVAWKEPRRQSPEHLSLLNAAKVSLLGLLDLAKPALAPSLLHIANANPRSGIRSADLGRGSWVL